MTASEISFLIGALFGSALTWIWCSFKMIARCNQWRKLCEDWKSDYVNLKRERTSGDEWKQDNSGRN